jgi:hypothetical protein
MESMEGGGVKNEDLWFSTPDGEEVFVIRTHFVGCFPHDDPVAGIIANESVIVLAGGHRVVVQGDRDHVWENFNRDVDT